MEGENSNVFSVWPQRNYICSFCKRQFNSAQALGGHMNVHRRDRAMLIQLPSWVFDHSSSSFLPHRHYPFHLDKKSTHPYESLSQDLRNKKNDNNVKMRAEVEELNKKSDHQQQQQQLISLDLEIGCKDNSKEVLDLELRLGCF
ncbi:zinc finger protein 11-like [Euphorbia lathyris]|uniref:zinc finger protein 11-like n=1 Tax=Euphorbia lathyris TaxID=212925 RepID=UPI003313BBB0